MQCNSTHKNRIDSTHDQVFARLLPLSYAFSLVSFVGDNFCACDMLCFGPRSSNYYALALIPHSSAIKL